MLKSKSIKDYQLPSIGLLVNSSKKKAFKNGKKVNFEIKNTIYLKEVLQSRIFRKSSSLLSVALGKNMSRNPFVIDLKKIPHLLIAGTFESDKDMGINSILLSLLYKNSPDTLKLLMIDSEALAFSIYNDIPHLLSPIIESKHFKKALNNMLNEMDRRYEILSRLKIKNIDKYNEKASEMALKRLPYIVIIINELASLIKVDEKEVEFCITRFAQMARAVGIHLIVATQQPSPDVITGLIKANMISRISFKVGSKMDSKVILDSAGAENLTGKGDMLFSQPFASNFTRVRVPYINKKEIIKVVRHIKKQRTVDYDENFV